MCLLNDILDYSKIESGQLELERAPFALRDCVEAVFDMFGSASAQKGIRLGHFMDDAVPAVVTGDVVRLRQVLINLVGNALKFTAKGKVTLTVSTQPAAAAAENCCALRFAVNDTGIGIPRNRLSRLFKSFSQVDASTTRKYGGTGLGLAISQKLVGLMGGQIQVESTESIGSCFSFAVEMHVAQWRDSHDGWTRATEAGGSILYVGDFAIHRQFFQQRAVMAGYAFVAVENWESVSDVLLETKGRCILICEPLVNSTQEAEIHRVIQKRPDIKLVILTPLGLEIREDLLTRVPQAELLSVPVRARRVDEILFQRRDIPENVEKTRPEDEKGAGFRVLVVDDNPINLRVAAAAVKQIGGSADTASNGAQAVEMVVDGHYDFVLMDIQMPEMDGFQTAKEIGRRVPSGRRPLVFVMSADTKESNQEAFVAAGMSGWISKPFRLPELERVLRSHMPVQSNVEMSEYILQ